MSEKDKKTNNIITQKITHNTVFGTKVETLVKPYYVEASFYNKFMKHVQSGSKRVIETKSRRTTIIPDFIGYTIGVHNGKTYKQILITDQMVGRKLGEFSPTRKFTSHPPLKGAKQTTGGKK